MTGKDYAVIAKVINDTRKLYGLLGGCDDGDRGRQMEECKAIGSYLALRRLAIDLAGVLEVDNPNFNRRVFLVACGFEPQ